MINDCTINKHNNCNKVTISLFSLSLNILSEHTLKNLTYEVMELKEDVCDMETTCDLLDKLVLKQLHLIEDKMCSELNLETCIDNGSFHLAKSRYIMGQNSVSKEKLPTEYSSEFSASIKIVHEEENDVNQLKIIENKEDSSITNPIHWFGVLVPQNLHKAKEIFKNALDHVVEAANIQLQIFDNMKSIEILKNYKKTLLESS